MTAFFIPGLAGERRVAEDAYGEMRRDVENDTGRRPSERRIRQLWSRRGGIDCMTEVGRPDPVSGGTVIAIFDLGPHEPFVVHREPGAGTHHGAWEILSSHAYTVLEFES